MPYKVDNHRKSDRIKITHYVSPHEIWFKYVDDYQVNKFEIERKVQQLHNVSPRDFNHSPSVGDIVIVQYCFGGIVKLIRARVDFEYQYAKGSEFVLWAIDEGYPIRASKKWIMKLPSVSLKGENPFVFKGTLNEVIPATVQFNILELESQKVKTKCWSEKAINQTEKILSDAQTLIFHYDCHAAQQHLFGSIEVISCTGKSVRLSEVLKNLEEAIECTGDFEKEYKLFTHKHYWDQQQENYKIKENGITSTAEPAVKDFTPSNSKQINVVEKVNDWDQRNKRSLSTENRDEKTITQAIEKCNITKEIPHNKRYQMATQNRASSSTSVISTDNNYTKAMSTASVKSNDKQSVCMAYSSNESFYSAKPVLFNEPKSSPNKQFKKALQQENFSIGHKDLVLMHCPEGLHVSSISSAKDANFTDEVHDALKSIRLTDLYRTQAVGWPHLMRGHSLLLVNAAKTGKTLTYLPAICSLLGEAHADETIYESDGPVMIIVCMNSSEADKILELCRKLLKGKSLNYNFSCIAAYGHRDEKTNQFHLLNGVDILVTTIPSLLKLMANPLKLFNKNRITTIVFDEIDSMCEQYGLESVTSIFKEFCMKPKSQADDNSVYSKTQFVVTSKTWHKVLKLFLQKNDVLICIAAYIEAAIYSDFEITVHSTVRGDHNKIFLSTLKSTNYTHESTIVICTNAQEVLEIKSILRSEGIAIKYYHEKSDSNKVESLKNQITQNPSGDLEVLICTDDVLLDLNVRHCQHIIHYSLPSNWTEFTRRFIASFDYYENLNNNILTAGRPTSVVFVNEESLDTFPRLIEFMKTRCFAKVSNQILQLAEKKRIQREESRVNKYNTFCEHLLMHGKCHSSYTCSYRHIFTKFDRPRDTIPRSGCIKFAILKVHTPAHYTVRLLQQRPLTKSKWQKVPLADDYVTFQVEFKKYFSDTNNHIIHSHPVLDDLCVIDEDDNEYKRCKIIGINKNLLTLQLIDTNETTRCSINETLVLPDRFKHFPPQAVDIRIAGVVPFEDTQWDKISTNTVKDWFKKCQSSEKYHIEGVIELALMDCIWVKDIEVKEKLPSINEETTSFFVKVKLIETKNAVSDPKAMEILPEMAKAAGILDTKPQVPTMYMQQSVNNQLRGRRGNKSLSSNDSTHSQTHLIDNSLTNEMQNISLSSSNGYLTSSESEASKSPRYQTLLSSSGLSETLEVWKERWASLDVGRFTKVDIGEFYSPDQFYVMKYNGYNSFKALKEKISRFTSDEKNLKPLTEASIGLICLTDYNAKDDYRRVKILEARQIENQTVVDVFLLDFGITEFDVPLNEVFEISRQLIEDLPFQAILCKIAGIRPCNNSDKWSNESLETIYDILAKSPDLFFQPIKQSANSDSMQCYSYEGIYAARLGNVNQFIVNENLAEFDPETGHIADVIVDFDSVQTSDSEDWDNDTNDNSYDAESYLSSYSGDGDISGFQWGDDIDVNFDEEDIMEMLGLPRKARLLDNNEQPIFPSRPAAVQEPKKTEKRTTGQKTKLVKSNNNQNQNQIHHPAKMPYISWEQTNEIITLSISAPEIKDYFLKVGVRYIHFSFVTDNERYESILNLFGCIDVINTSHEIRGLNIKVKLMKTIPGLIWPRLVRSPDKNRYLKYKISGIDDYSDSSESDIEYVPHNSNYNHADSSGNEDGSDRDVSDME